MCHCVPQNSIIDTVWRPAVPQTDISFFIFSNKNGSFPTRSPTCHPMSHVGKT